MKYILIIIYHLSWLILSKNLNKITFPIYITNLNIHKDNIKVSAFY